MNRVKHHFVKKAAKKPASKPASKKVLTHPWQWVDWLYLQTSKGKLFSDGWGDAELIAKIQKDSQLITKPASITPVFTAVDVADNPMIRRYDYEFLSPVPGLPDEVKMARGCLIIPAPSNADSTSTPSSLYGTPVCLSMPGSGEEGYARRIKALAEPLAKQGIATLILENPFYGSRRRKGQNKHFVATVSDFLLMFYSAIEECKALANHWLVKGQNQVGLTGLSMGGQAVSLVATQIAQPLAVIPSLAPSSVAEQYSFGYLSVVCDWQALSQGTVTGAGIATDNQAQHDARTKLGKLLQMGDITNFPVPEQSICRIINAKNDTYIPLHLSQSFVEHWPHSTVKLIRGGHISSILFKNKPIVDEIARTLSTLAVTHHRAV